MKLGEKLKFLRSVEGTLRGLARPLSQSDVSRLVADELGGTISQSYLSQIESGARRHLTSTSRTLLARFFQVHPGYLVDDPADHPTEPSIRADELESRLDLWLLRGSELFRRDPDLASAMFSVARHKDSRRCFLLIRDVIESPKLYKRVRAARTAELGSRARGRKRKTT